MVFVSKPNQITCTASQHITLQPSCVQRQHGLISKTTFSLLVINVMSSFSTFYKHVLFSNSFNRTHDNHHQLSTQRWESLQIFASGVIHQAAGEMWTLTKYINKKWTSRSVLNVSRNTSRHSAWRRNCVDVETFCWKSGSICWKNRCSRPAVGVYITQNALSTTFWKSEYMLRSRRGERRWCWSSVSSVCNAFWSVEPSCPVSLIPRDVFICFIRLCD